MNKKFLKQAYKYAEKYSTDPNTQNGAILVDKNGKVVARGANHFPKGVKDTKSRWIRPDKYMYVEHAERNAIYNAARKGIKTKGVTMYCPWAACTDCARAIIQSGIAKVVIHKQRMELSSKKWMKEIELSIQMFKEANVKLVEFDGKIGGVSILIKTKKYQP